MTGALDDANQEREEDQEQPLLEAKWRQASIKQKQVTNLESEDGTAGVVGSVFNLCTTIVGAGIMALPAAVKVLGVPLAVVIMLAMGYMSEASSEMIVRFLSKLNVGSYEDMVAGVCGRVARIAAQVCVIVFTIGILVGYLIIIADVLAGTGDHVGLLEQMFGRPGLWNIRPLMMFLTIVLVLLPLSGLEKLDSLKYTSALSIALALLFVVLTVAVAGYKLALGHAYSPRMLPDFSSPSAVYQVFAAVPVMTTAFACQFNVPLVYQELRDESRGKMYTVARHSLAFCTILYIVTGISGYLLFGEATAPDILSNFDADLRIPYGVLINYVIRVGYAIHVVLVFPVIFFSLRRTSGAALFPAVPPATDESRSKFLLLTLALFFIIFLFSTVTPDILIAFNLSGATTGTCVAFVFPGVVALMARARDDPRERYQRIVSWIMLPTAILSGLVGVITQIMSLV